MEKRRAYILEEKASIVLQLLKEERTISQIAAETGIHTTVLARWKAEAIDNLPSLFTRGASEMEKMCKKYEAEKEELARQIGQLTVELTGSKNLQNSASVEERDLECREITLKSRPSFWLLTAPAPITAPKNVS
ncbi:transposase IS3/IS911 family protein [Thermosinus carboxydivorans Nor1]|uniref:Transposase IS3/IS911 family protein n=1 Tax=Thermosinus carboxydivorans Nor1 TaxID=401526 RepID=A1HNC3_9FIRM|nr:transposase [Thermosinus carboxydivorans]EAX48477.1 transposase IS3/IS911 family protein [Thermosinus carboxydivorans Nor1]